MKLFIYLALIIIGLCSTLLNTPNAQDNGGHVMVMTMEGAIGPAFSGYLETGIARAEAENAQAIIIELNTPGGLLSSTRDMVSDIVESPVPVIVWTTPSGAHAASAGTFIMYAAHINAMDSGTNLGAATPIEMGGSSPAASEDEGGDANQEAMKNKALEDTSAFIRGLAEMRGRNAEWAQTAVTEAKSLTAEEALKENVIDMIATNRGELISKLHGREVALKNGTTVTLDTDTAPVKEFKPDWKVSFLSMITDPNIALILMSIGVYGLILEFYNPGTMIPGTIGAICLIIGLYAMNVLPINAAGIILLVLGLIFMIAEAFIPSFGILGFGGLAAFVVGLAIMFDSDAMPGLTIDGGVIAGVAILGAIIIGLVVFLTVKVYRKEIDTGVEGMIGKKAEIVEWKDDHGRVRVQGEVWSAYADSNLDLKAEDTVIVAAVNQTELTIKIIAT
ncbi:MAG TPA: nodulation protein NfeD [Micavibrio sp.]|nr:nodulation protein NfeD [Micavibrio sp.]